VIPLRVDELRGLALGTLEGDDDAELTGVQIDSRRIRPGDLFVAVGRGAGYIADARAAGASATLDPTEPFAALAVIAGLVRDRASARVVGLTGSTGKTSTKDILSALCAPVARTLASEASFNNELGVPLTVCRLEHDTELLLVEMGMRGFGQIAELCGFVRPDAGIVTAIGPAHLELVGDLDGVARAKAELLLALPPGGIAVVPAGGTPLDGYLRSDHDVHRVPRIDDVDVEVERDAAGGTIRFRGHQVRFNLTARHQLQNALTALVAFAALGLPLDRAGEGAASAVVSRWRGEELPLPGGGAVINDAYNANPDSTRAALLHLRERAGAGRALAVLGGMAELGATAPAYHLELAALARELEIDVLAVGELARLYGVDDWVPDADAAVARLRGSVRPADTVLVKASRAVGLEGVAPALANPEAAWSVS
jgi:UDP-N-acetylmuramoyl-tripeptide--D-alanyl-D-alanine ligase